MKTLIIKISLIKRDHINYKNDIIFAENCFCCLGEEKKMKHDFNLMLERRYNGSMKWEASYINQRFQTHFTDEDKFYPLFIADMDFTMDQGIKDKLMEFVGAGDFGYFHVQDSFYTSIIKWHEDIHHTHIQKEWITPSIGTITSLHLLSDLFSKDKNILILTPVYGPFYSCAQLGKAHTMPLTYIDHEYVIDFEKLEKTFQKKHIHTLLFCNPHNPGGKAWSYDELNQLVGLCKKYNVMILSDEIHSDILISSKPFVSLVCFFDQYDRIFVSTSPNKTFNISGLSTSYTICSNEDLNQQFNNYLSSLHIGAQRLGIYMIEIVYNEGRKWYQGLLEYLRRNIEMTIFLLETTDMEVMKPDAGYLIWIHLPKVKNIDQFIMDLANQTHVLLETGSRFIENNEGWLRINTATNHDLLKEAIEKLMEFYNHYEM